MILSLILSTIIMTSTDDNLNQVINTSANSPTEIIATANTKDGKRKEVIVEQPKNSTDPFGNIAPIETTPKGEPTVYTTPEVKSPTPKTVIENPEKNAPEGFTPEVMQKLAPTIETNSTNQEESANTNTQNDIINQTSSTDHTNMNMNATYYKNKIENTVYREGDRLYDVQSIPINDINSAITPNENSTITDYPSF